VAEIYHSQRQDLSCRQRKIITLFPLCFVPLITVEAGYREFLLTKIRLWRKSLSTFIELLPVGTRGHMRHLVYRVEAGLKSLSRRWKVKSLLAAPSPIGRRLPTKSHLKFQHYQNGYKFPMSSNELMSDCRS